MQHRKESASIKKLRLGMMLRCPNCEVGKIGRGMFNIQPTCPVCEVRFERAQGEQTGGMMVTMVALLIVGFATFIVVEVGLNHPPIIIQMGVPLIVATLFGLLFYRHARGLWVAVDYLTGNVYADEDDQ